MNWIIRCTKFHYCVTRVYCIVMRKCSVWECSTVMKPHLTSCVYLVYFWDIYVILVSEPSFLSAWLSWSSPSGGTGKMWRLVDSWPLTLDPWPLTKPCCMWRGYGGCLPRPSCRLLLFSCTTFSMSSRCSPTRRLGFSFCGLNCAQHQWLFCY